VEIVHNYCPVLIIVLEMYNSQKHT